MARRSQEQLLEIFNALKSELKPYENGHIKARFDIEGKYDLWSEKPDMTVLGKRRAELSFAAIIVQSSYVGFYYMPIYTNTADVRSLLAPELLRHLKGKACFHIKAIDDELLNDIRLAMKVGFEEYQKNGWV